MTHAGWEPEGEVDRDLLAARQDGDTDAFLIRLAGTDLLLPLPSGTGPVGWATGQISGRRWVLAFTSASAMKRSLGADPPHRVARFPELAGTWPDPALDLAVNPGLPIEAYLSADGVVDLAAAASRPATGLEGALAAALEAEDLEAYARALLEIDVAVPADGPVLELTDPQFPWLRLDEDGAIVVFTSETRLRDQLGTQPYVRVAFADLVQAWPDPEAAAAVDPGTTYAGLLAGPVIGYLGGRVEEIGRLAEDALAQAGTRTDLTEPERMGLAERLVRERLRPPAAAPGTAPVPVPGPGTAPVPEPVPVPGPMVQVVVPAGQVDRYLNQRHRRVAGLIHRQPPDTPPIGVLYRRLGLLGDGSPFGEDDDVGYLLRWRAPDPTAYQVPAMDGIEIPDGTSLWRVDRDGEERRLATYHSALAAWSRESGPR